MDLRPVKQWPKRIKPLIGLPIACLLLVLMFRWFEHTQVYHPDRVLTATGKLPQPFMNPNSCINMASGKVSILEPTGEVIFAEYIELTGDMKDGVGRDLRLRLVSGGDSKVKVKQMVFHRVGGRTIGHFIIPEKENYHLESVLPRLEQQFAGKLEICRDQGAVSLIGAGITDRYEFLQRCLAILAEKDLGPSILHTSSFRISALVSRWPKQWEPILLLARPLVKLRQPLA